MFSGVTMDVKCCIRGTDHRLLSGDTPSNETEYAWERRNCKEGHVMGTRGGTVRRVRNEDAMGTRRD